MIEQIREMLSAWPQSWSVSEKNIAELVLAAAEKEILDVLSEYKVNGNTVIHAGDVAKMAKERCFLCVFRKESARVYAICFGRNPTDIRGYPRKGPYLERASRASDFVSALLNVINRDYNCFFVPTNIGYPACDTVKKRLRLPDKSQVTYVRESDLTLTADDRRTYELEFIIMASVGEHFRRMNDCVIVKTLKQDTYEYEYHREAHTILTRSQAEAWAKVNAARKTSRSGKAASRSGQATGNDADKSEVRDDLQSILAAVQRPEEKKKILDVFAASPSSEFSQFMRSLEGEKDLKVGQINLTPCSIFVSSIPQKTYVYAITDPEEPAKSVEISLVWNKPAEDFTVDTPLYIDAEGGFLKGLTYMQDYVDPASPDKRVARQSFDPSDTLVIARSEDGGRVMTLRRPDGQDPNYKGVACAVYVDHISQKISQQYKVGYYTESAVKYMPIWKNNNRYSEGTKSFSLISDTPVPVLTVDLARCPVSGVEYWNGDAMKKNVFFVNDEGTGAKSDMIFIGALSAEYMHRCAYCGVEIYANGDRWTAYQSKYRLLDGSSACESCAKQGNTIAVNNKRYRFFEKVYDTGSKENHPLFVVWDDGKNAISAKDGNAYKCANCQKVVYMPPNSSGIAYRDCTVCKSRICPDCNQSAETKRLITGQPLCECCFHSPPGLVNQGKTVYKAWNKAENKEEYVLDGIRTIESIFHCAECGRPVFYKPSVSYRRCECCGKLVGDACWPQMTKDASLNLRLCKSCRAETREKGFQDLVTERDTAREAQKTIQVTVKRKEAEITRNWRATFLRDLKKYLPYMTLADRSWFKRNKNKLASFEITVHECFYHETDKGGEQTVVRFSVRLKKRRPITYAFLNNDGNVALDFVVGG